MINNVTLVGRLTKDADLRYTPNGVPVATMTLAVNRTFTNQQGQREADFINCVVWRKPAENLANYTKKGSLVGVTGSIQTRNFDGSDGKKVYVTEVLVNSVQFLDSKNSGQGGGQQGNPYQQKQHQGNQPNQNGNPYGGPIDINDDQLPF